MRALRLVIAAACIAAVVAACGPPPPPTTHTGTSAADAAPSCWAIKQAFPNSADGVYWLYTAALQAPQQFYCDMTTSGGGWVLVARGRDGWTFRSDGQGTPTQVHTTITGPTAFPPAALPAPTIDALLNGGRVDALNDGIRIRRARDAGGTTWQEVNFHLATQRAWSWALGGGELLTSIDFDGVSHAISGSSAFAGSTADTAVDDAYQRIFTWPWVNHGNRAGFGYGSAVAGSSSSTSYLWALGTENFALPFSQVWLRPMIGDAGAGFTTIPDSGTAASAPPPHLSNVPQPTPWGVTGLVWASDPDSANQSPVMALAQIGNTIYVGGRFRGVQQGSGGTIKYQRWLAAFDATTGAWISGFRPMLDGTVFALRAAPNGQLIVGGNFTNVNNVANTAGLAMLDPTTGAVSPSWQAIVASPRFGGTRPYVRNLDLRGNVLYVVGSFNSISGGSPMTSVTTGGIARISASTGAPDATWKAAVDNTPVSVRLSVDGTRVYVAGRFAHVGTSAIRGVAVLDATTAAPVTGLQAWQPNTTDPTTQYAQTVLDLGNGNVTVGGSQHSWQMYRASDFAFERAHEARYGGDFQTQTLLDGILYASCHCGNWDYSDDNTWPLSNEYSRVAPIDWTGAYDPATLTQLEAFEPRIQVSTNGEGVWALLGDTQHCLWLGGDIVAGASGQWAAGFVRLCPADTTPPTTPANAHTVTSGGSTTLQWTASTDGSGVAPTYEVLLEDRVVGLTSATSFTVSGSGRWFVRAVDGSGNRSASSPAVTVP